MPMWRKDMAPAIASPWPEDRRRADPDAAVKPTRHLSCTVSVAAGRRPADARNAQFFDKIDICHGSSG